MSIVFITLSRSCQSKGINITNPEEWAHVLYDPATTADIDDWENVFYNGKFKCFLSCFDAWDDYLRCDGDFHKKIK